jgi:hypothetical protein
VCRNDRGNEIQINKKVKGGLSQEKRELSLIAGANVGAGVDAEAGDDGHADVPCIVRDDDKEGVSWTEWWVLVAVARGNCLRMKRSDPRVRWATCPQDLSLPRGQKCLYRCLRGHGRYHRSVSSARIGRLVSSS